MLLVTWLTQVAQLTLVSHVPQTTPQMLPSYSSGNSVIYFLVSFIGGNPYPNLPPTEIYRYIVEGNRMERPVDCPEEMYVL